MSKKIIPINYTSRDYNSIKADLIQHAKRYYENTYQDFNEGSFGSLMLDTVAYVGDILSFYLDYQVNETFLDTASEFENVIKIGKQAGYQFSNAVSSTGIATFYISVPANTSGLGPNLSYAPILKKGSTFSSNSNVKFILNEDVRFDNPNNDVRVLNVASNGTPTTYAIKAKGTVISGLISSETIEVGDYERFKKIKLSQQDIVEIISVFDTEGNQYYEVDYLSQNVIYRSITNRNITDYKLAKEILKPFMVPRRFVVKKGIRDTELQFGASSDVIVNDDLSMITEPITSVLELYGKNYISEDSFDPTKLLYSDKLGVAPSNTSIVVTYRYNTTSENVNCPTNGLNSVQNPIFEFINENSLADNLISNVKFSLEVTNESPLLGDINVVDSQELKRKIENSFAAQSRAVTINDYQALSYSMPNKFGSIKRVNVVRDDNSLKRNINIYTLCEDHSGFLIAPNLSVKNNLKTWLIKNKMLNDSIDILDGKIVNYSINFTAMGRNDRSKYDILTESLEQLRKDFSILGNFGETFFITNIYDSLKKVDGILDVINVIVEQKVGNLYSNVNYNIKANTSSDGRYINVPLNVVMELKYPNNDIRGTII
jgi:hypothetical protein